MSAEMMICVLCLVSFFMLCWALLLRAQVNELGKKVVELERYFSIKKKLDDI